MKKTELIEDMKKYVGAGYVTREELRRYMGYQDPHQVDRYLKGLERIGKKYFIPDVVEVLLKQRCV